MNNQIPSNIHPLKRQLGKKLILLALCYSGTQLSHAGDWSVGAFAGQSKIDGLTEACLEAYDAVVDPALLPLILRVPANCNNDDSDRALGLYVAYNFTNNWALEAGYVDLGTFGSEIISGLRLDVDATTIYGAGVYTLPVSDRFSVSGRLGFHNASVDLNVSQPLFFDLRSYDTELEVYAGASLNYEISDTLSAQLRYDNFDVETVGLGLAYRFR